MSESSLAHIDTHARLSVIEGQVGNVIASQSELKSSMSEIRDLLTRVVVVEERISTSNAATGRVFAELKELRDTVERLDTARGSELSDLRLRNAREIGWIAGALGVGGILAMVVGWVIKTNIDPLLTLPQQVTALQAEVHSKHANP